MSCEQGLYPDRKLSLFLVIKYIVVGFNHPKKSIAQKSRYLLFWILVASGLQLVAFSCTTVDLYEKTAVIPGHAWQSSFKPSFSFTIKDTTQKYQLFLVLRHTEKYNFSNIYIKLHVQHEGGSSGDFTENISLATQEGWKTKGMDDIYEHREPIGEPGLLKKGTYTFTLEQIMREDPLQHVLNAGIRLEKKSL